MAQKQEIMPGIFMTAQQQGDSFSPYFEYKLENTRASGKRVEVSSTQSRRTMCSRGKSTAAVA